MSLQTGYCTNVHPGADLDALKASLAHHAVSVRQQIAPCSSLGVGLWLSARTAAHLVAGDGSSMFAFRDWLAEHQLHPYTLNGFPYGDFQQRVVKHDVYLPDWTSTDRVDYTRNLIRILHGILPGEASGTISTLPLFWGKDPGRDAHLSRAANNLSLLAAELRRLRDTTGRQIMICLEPEPGCALDRSQDVLRFFEEFLSSGEEPSIREHLGVCHDICHAAVMFEPQAEALRAYDRAGITVGKIQVSSALRLPSELDAASRDAAIHQLAQFAEDRFLHQTVIRGESHDDQFYEDLPQALRQLRSIPKNRLGPEARVHFHVPIHLAELDLLPTTQADIPSCLDYMAAHGRTPQLEVETYAWSVLPAAHQPTTLADGITAELKWLHNLLAKQTAC